MRVSFIKGAGLIEVAFGVAIIALFIVGILLAFRQYLAVGLGNTAKLQAAYFAEEGIEIARALRDNDWTSFAALSTSTTYYLTNQSGTWATTTTATTSLPGFIRTLTLGAVYRSNTSNDIVPVTASNKYLDPYARSVSVTVSWIGITRSTTAISYATYLTKLF